MIPKYQVVADALRTGFLQCSAQVTDDPAPDALSLGGGVGHEEADEPGLFVRKSPDQVHDGDQILSVEPA